MGVLRARRRSVLFVVVLVLLEAACAGCKVGPDYSTPAVELANKWRTSDDRLIYGKPSDVVEWWKTFNDPVLDALVAQALAQNLDLQTAALRLIEGRLARRGATWLFFPAVQASASAVHANFSTTVKPNVRVNAPGILPPPNKKLVSIEPEMNIYDAGFDALWELDVWGKNRRIWEAANANMSAIVAGYDDVLVSLVAEVAASYVQLRTLEQRLAATREILEQEKKFLAITEERFRKGEALETDVLLAKTLVGITLATVPAFEGSIQETENALCLLLGKAPHDLRQELGGAGAIPLSSAAITVGVPADLLRRRPDVRMAEALAHVQCARIGRTKAEVLFPSFNLFGTIGFKSSSSSDLFDSDSHRSAFGAIATWNILMYPALVDAIRVQDVRFEQAMLQYRETVLGAAAEAENAIAAFATSREELKILADNVSTAKRCAEMTVAAYDAGKVIVSVPLVGLTILQSQQDAELAQRGQAAMNMIAIYKALGGGWEVREGMELLPEEMIERMKSRTDWWTLGGGVLDTSDLPMPESEPADSGKPPEK